MLNLIGDADRTHASHHPFLTRHSKKGEEGLVSDRTPHTNKRDRSREKSEAGLPTL